MNHSKSRSGFTLIELLVVVVIIGILAAIAIPRYQTTRVQSFRATLVSDLKHVVTAQELFWANNQAYADDLEDLNIAVSDNVAVTFHDVTENTWGASAAHAAVPGETCAVFSGGTGSTPVAPAEVADRITCTF